MKGEGEGAFIVYDLDDAFNVVIATASRKNKLLALSDCTALFLAGCFLEAYLYTPPPET